MGKMVNNWYAVGIVNASSYRLAVLEELMKGNTTPSDLESFTRIKISHISRALKELSDAGLVKCLTPELRKNKIYSITDKGKKVIKTLRAA